MHLRPTTREDVYQVAKIGTAGFATDPLFDTICPGHTTHRADFEATALARHKQNLVTPGLYSFVCVSDARDGPDRWTGTEEILGYAVWKRKGDPQTSKGAAAWHQSHQGWGDMLERTLLDVEATYAKLVRLDRSVDKVEMAKFEESIEHVLDNVGDNWYLASIVTASKHLRRGVASLLIDWGLKMAELEGLPTTLLSSTIGEKTYRTKGFKMVDWADGQPGVNPTGVMIRDDFGDYVRPAEQEEQWVVRQGEKMPIDVVWKQTG